MSGRANKARLIGMLIGIVALIVALLLKRLDKAYVGAGYEPSRGAKRW